MNVEGLTIDIERCQDGVELVDLPGTGLYGPEAAGTLAGSSHPVTVFRPRTDRREVQTMRLSNLENPIVIAFVNATDDEDRLQFFDQYGFLGRPMEIMRRDSLLGFQAHLRQTLQRFGSGADPASTMAGINQGIAERREFNPQLTFHLAGPRGTPRLLLKSETLYAFMIMEMAMVVAHGVRVTECEKCSEIFLTGALTWRRAHARFCSDRCRVAAMRARQKTAGG
jgi:hypothetical protein